jgi:hypothetical protein
MNHKWILIAATAAATLTAQVPAPHLDIVTAGQPDGPNMVYSQMGTTVAGVPGGGNMGMAIAGSEAKFVSFEMSMNGKPVTGAPYAADAVTETTQTLGDGNHITRKTTNKNYRDSQGRTRREQSFQTIGPWSTNGDTSVMVQINDPVAGVNYSLNSAAKEATKIEMMSPPTHAQMAADVQRNIAKVKTSGAHVSTFNAKVSPAKEESLGSQMINGVQADGTKNTITIPAGQIGNDLPIDIVDERWYSTELQTLVKSVHSDPRMGTTTYQLTNIDRAEPSPSLFEVPADYKVNTFDRSSGPGSAMDKIMTEKIMIRKDQE